ncbi:MAG: FtsX-like permease family protein, partial [Deltaproteobacteria bacterium]
MKNERLSLVRLSWKSVVRKLFRNAVLLLAVFLLVSLLVFALLFNHAVQTDLEGTTRKLGADIVMVPVEAMDPAQEFILESKEKTFYMDAGVYDSVRKMDDVEAATYQIYLNTLASGCCSIVDAQVVAIDQKTDFIVRSWIDNPKPLGPGEVYIGSYVYEYLGLISTPSLFGHKVQVIGHLEPTGTGLDHAIFMRQEDLSMVAKDARGKYKDGEISIIFLKIKAGRDLDEVVSRIQSANPTIGILTRGTIGTGIRDILADIMRIFQVTIFCSGTLAILLVWSAFTALTNERRREVGILRAIGARRLHIIAMYLGEAGIIGGIGSLLGVGGGVLLLQQLGKQFHLLSRIASVQLLTPSSLQYCLAGWLCGVAVCLIGAWLPVLR